MKRIRLIGVLCLVAIYGAVLGYAFRQPTHSRIGEEVIRLRIPPEALDLGTVWEDDHFAWTVPIENEETVPVEVTSFSKTCNCLSMTPDVFVLEPGERRELHLQIDLTKQTKTNGEVSIELFPHVKTTPGTELAKRRPPRWTVKGQVRRVLALARSVDLGRHSELAQPLPAREIPIDILVPLESIAVECSLPNFAGSVRLPSSGRGKTTLRLAESTSLPVGAFQGTVALKPLRQGGKSLPARRLRVAGAIVPDVETVPPVVQVGGRRLGETFEEVILLRSMTGQTLGSVRAEAGGEGLTVESVKEGGGYRIRQKVCREGSQINRVRFFTESDKKPINIIVPVNYTGIKAE